MELASRRFSALEHLALLLALRLSEQQVAKSKRVSPRRHRLSSLEAMLHLLSQ